VSAERYRALPWRREVKFPETRTFVSAQAMVARDSIFGAFEGLRCVGPFDEALQAYPAIRLGTAETVTVIADHDLGDCT
jgi:hypothetical protein